MHLVEILIPISLFACLFGIFYLYFSTRHRERMALIEKGTDASLFVINKEGTYSRGFLVLNIALTLIGIGLGITFGVLLYDVTNNEAVFPASIFTMAGIGLLVSFFIAKKQSKK